MQARIVFTFPFVFPRFPRGNALISKFEQGSDSLFGIAIDHGTDDERNGAVCSFFTIDVLKQEVVQHTMVLPDRGLLGQLGVYYDHYQKTWVVAIDALVYGRPIDVYLIPQDPHAPWTQVFTTQSLKTPYLSERALIGFWQCGDYYPLLFCNVDKTGMYDLDTYWTQWARSPINQPSFQYLNTNYQREIFVSDDGFLLFTLQCIYDEMTSDVVYRKMGSGQWRFHVAAYTSAGVLMHQEIVPNITMPVHDRRLAIHDLFAWLTYSMAIGDGPILPDEQKTCIAALVMQDNPDAKRGPDDPLLSFSNQGREAKGGLYCIDMRGHILCHDSSLVGLRTSFYANDDQVIGVTLQDGQWQLWRWLPFQGTARVVQTCLSSDIRRVTVLARECKKGEGPSWFWCIEEYEMGIRVTQRLCETFMEKQSLWVEGTFLPDWWMRPGTVDTKPQGIVAYQDSLLIIGVNHAKQLVLYQFQ